MASVPIIIPILVLIVALVFILLSIFHLIRKLFGCPYQKSSYPFDQESFDKKRRSVLPANPYTIDPSSPSSNNSTVSPNSVYYKGGMLLYPAIEAASAPSRSPTLQDPDDQIQKNDHQDETFDLDTVDRQIESLADTPSPNSSNTTGEDTHILLTVHSTDFSSPEHLNNFDNIRKINRWDDNHFESDV